MSSPTTPGGRVLQQRSAYAKARAEGYRHVLVVEDTQLDSDRLNGIVHMVLGYDVEIRRAKSLTKALDEAIASKPDIVLLDDRLKPKDTADDTIPFLRRIGYEGPIIVMSSLLTRRRQAELAMLGATTSLHKDDLDGTSFAGAIDIVQKAIAAGTVKVHARGTSAGADAAKPPSAPKAKP
jgi:DNA-binding NarL/FixJ family response regulator